MKDFAYLLDCNFVLINGDEVTTYEGSVDFREAIGDMVLSNSHVNIRFLGEENGVLTYELL